MSGASTSARPYRRRKHELPQSDVEEGTYAGVVQACSQLGLEVYTGGMVRPRCVELPQQLTGWTGESVMTYNDQSLGG
jgi:hypothetical protein